MKRGIALITHYLADLLLLAVKTVSNFIDRHIWAYLLAIAVFGLTLYGTLFWLLYLAIKFFISLLAGPPKSYFMATILGGLAVILGAALYNFRVAARVHYGIVEAMFGVAFIFSSSSPNPIIADDRVQIIQIGAGIYIIVRGLDNVKSGLEERPLHRGWRLWRRLFLTGPILYDVTPKHTGFNKPEEVGLVRGLDHDTVEPWADVDQPPR